MPYHRCPACGLTGYSAAAWSTARTCANCGAPLPADSRLDLVPHASHSVGRRLPAHPHAAAQARHTVAALDVSQCMRDALALVASELVNNAVLHAGLSPDDSIDLHMDVDSDGVRLAVHDAGRGFDPAMLNGRSEFLAAGGNGLVIVESIAATWGVDRGEDGCTVWCELTPASAAEEAARAHDERRERVHARPVEPAVIAVA